MTKVFPLIIRFFVMVLGKTMDSHKTFLDRITISPRLREVFSEKDSDVIFAFVPIVSRAGTDIQAAVEKLPQSKPVVLVALHHTFNTDYVAPDSRAHVNKERVFAVDCLFHEDQGLLNCLRNENAIRAVKKHLNTETSVGNNRWDICAWDFDNNELIPWTVSELIIMIAWSILPEYISIIFFFIENILMIVVGVIQNYFNLNKFTFYIFIAVNIALILYLISQRITTIIII